MQQWPIRLYFAPNVWGGKKKTFVSSAVLPLPPWVPSLTEAPQLSDPSSSPLRSLGSYFPLIYVSAYTWKSCRCPSRRSTQIFSLQSCRLTWGMSVRSCFFKFLPDSSSNFFAGHSNIINTFHNNTHLFVVLCVCSMWDVFKLLFIHKLILNLIDFEVTDHSRTSIQKSYNVYI